MWTLDFFPAFPNYADIPWIKALNLRTAAPQLRRAIRELNFREYVLWISTPWAAGLTKRVAALCVCYDCMDNFPAFYQGRLRDYLEETENQLVRRCDLVVASSESLYAKCRKMNPNVHLVRNGLMIDRFVRDGISTPPELARLSRPILGYSGYVAEWLDVELLREVALHYSHASLVLLGPVHERALISRLSDLPNVHFLGMKPHADVPGYINGFDVCLIPFQRNDLTTAVNPVKFYEYCALGKPTVSVTLPELEPYKELCYLASSQEQFLGAVSAALREHDDQDYANRLALCRQKLAKENSWETRGHQLEAILLGERGRAAKAVT
jgi:glycosyltransferase involved in cell wall biosynthesis